MFREPLGGVTIRAAVLAGFALTLGIWVFTDSAFTRRMAAVERDASAATVRYVRAQESLSVVRAQLLQGAMLVRDALQDVESANHPRHRERVNEAYAAMDRQLRSYVPVVGSAAEREQVQRLRREVDAFREMAEDLLNGDESKVDVRDALNSRLVPRREAVFNLSEQIQSLNRGAYLQYQAEIEEQQRAAAAESRQRLLTAVGVSLIIALLATLYSSRLENRLRRQRDKDAQNSRDLQRLSAKLITAQE